MGHAFQVYTELCRPSSSELDLVVNLDLSEFPRPWSKISWQNFLKSQNFALFILPLESTVCFALFQINSGDSFGHLLKILVPSSLRGQKLGRDLLNEAVCHLQKTGINRFFLEVEETNISAQQLYLKQGFKVVHRNKNFYGPDQAALIMTLGEN